MPTRTSVPAETAEVDRIVEAVARLAPHLAAYLATNGDGPFPPYRSARADGAIGPLPDMGIGLDATIGELGAIVEGGSRIGAPGFLSFITTAATTGAATAHLAVAVAGGQRYMLHAFNAVEHESLRWLAELCGLPDDTVGVYSSGGSTANLIALGAARQAAFESRGLDASQDGLPAGVRCRIYVSDVRHRTIDRAAAVLGLGRAAVSTIPVDGEGRMRIDELEARLAADRASGVVPLAVVATAGVTDTGAVDRIDRAAAVARRYRAWLHVDGAYGLVANAVPELGPLFSGLEEADSWIVDPHKWLATGLGVSATFVRDEGVLTRAFAEGDAAYLEGSFHDEHGAAGSQFDALAGRWADQSLELSAPPRGVLVWSVLREIGREGVVARVRRHVAFAREVADRARAHPRLELLMEPQLSIACFRYLPPSPADADALNAAILRRLRHETTIFPSSTVVDGRYAIRPCFINPRTTEREVDLLVESVVRFGDELIGR